MGTLPLFQSILTGFQQWWTLQDSSPTTMVHWRAETVLAATLAAVSRCQSTVDLGTYKWTLSNPLLNVSVPAQFPSHAHVDLFANQVTGDPYYGLNNFNLRWVAWANWTYSAVLSPM